MLRRLTTSLPAMMTIMLENYKLTMVGTVRKNKSEVKDVIGTPADELLEPVHLGKDGVLCVLQSRTRSMWLDVLSVSHLSVENTNKLFAKGANEVIVLPPLFSRLHACVNFLYTGSLEMGGAHLLAKIHKYCISYLSSYYCIVRLINRSLMDPNLFTPLEGSNSRMGPTSYHTFTRLTIPSYLTTPTLQTPPLVAWTSLAMLFIPTLTSTTIFAPQRVDFYSPSRMGPSLQVLFLDQTPEYTCLRFKISELFQKSTPTI
uniref:Uncharacterized protein n=1 Tax=Timema monikensis TaxID=170555 RepID=A0A7R9HW94_9NEOP|nr:unnamed protein product [Timema monikensis]